MHKSRRIRKPKYAGDPRKACTILVGEPEEARTLGRHMCRTEDDIKTDLKKKRYESKTDQLAQEKIQLRAVLNTIMIILRKIEEFL